MIEKICQFCGEKFLIENWRLKDPSRGKYCSQACFHEARRRLNRKKHYFIGE